MNGHCMCNAVTVEVAALGPGMTACHCEMCRRWTGTAFVAVHATGADVAWQGPVKTGQFSAWAERGWCDDCGTTLFYRIKGDGSYGLSAGLFENAADHALTGEYYIDQKPAGWGFGGEHTRMTRAESLAHFGVTEEDMQ